MPNPNISATLTNEDVAAIIAAAESIKAKIPFGVTLTPEQRQALPKLGTRSGGFVAEAQAVAATHPDLFPAAFDSEEFARDAALFEKLLQVYVAVGTGTQANNRSNAFEVYSSGKVRLPRQGDILMGEFGHPGD